MSYARFFNSKGRGYTLLAVKRDVARERDVKIYYIDEDTHVGINDGVDSWIASIGSSLFFDFAKDELAGLIARVKAGETIQAITTTIERKRLVLDIPPILRKSIKQFQKRALT